MIRIISVATLACCLATPTLAQKLSKKECETSPIAYRLPECDGIKQKPGSVKAPEDSPEATPSRTYKVVDPADVRATPSKWQDRDIEFKRVNVYWVEDHDVRLLTGTSLTVFAIKVDGSPADLAFFKSSCETSKEASSRVCQANLRFSYVKHGEDTPGGFAKRTVLITRSAELKRLNTKR